MLLEEYKWILTCCSKIAKAVESKALKLYLFSYRNFHSFHEEVVNRVLTDLSKACKPRWMEVTGDFMPRGGISLKIVAETGSLKR